MNMLYQEWLPSAAGLAGLVAAYWRVSGDGLSVPPSAVLPDGHVELVLNLGDPVGLSGPAYSGLQPARAVVGPLSKALRLEYRGQVDTFGVRFHPARGAGFLGKVATALADKLLPLADVRPSLDRELERLLTEHPCPETDAGREAIDRALLGQLPSALPPDLPLCALIDRLSGADSMPPVTEIAQELGISSRQLQRRFLAAVGAPPKQFFRVLRFARVWQLASMRPRETWAALAAEHGYADQAHLTREFRAFGAEPPTHVFTPDWYDATELSRVSGPAQGVRSVQDTSPRPKV
jgi:AraC-like DNA-binding protein